MHEEAGRFDIQLLGYVLTDLDQALAALVAGATLRVVAMLDAREMIWNGLPTGAFALGLPGRCDLFDFGFQRAGVAVPAFLEQLALFGGELFALVGKANALVVGELEGQGLDCECIAFGLFEQFACPSSRCRWSAKPIVPSQVLRRRVFWIRCERPSMPARMAIASTTSQTWVGVGVVAVAATGRPATVHHRSAARFSSRPGCGAGRRRRLPVQPR
jgi:hypothetical protein